jgi:hypothetical protein
MSGLVYGVGQLEAKSAKLSNTSNSEINSAKDSNTCRRKTLQARADETNK